MMEISLEEVERASPVVNSPEYYFQVSRGTRKGGGELPKLLSRSSNGELLKSIRGTDVPVKGEHVNFEGISALIFWEVRYTLHLILFVLYT